MLLIRLNILLVFISLMLSSRSEAAGYYLNDHFVKLKGEPDGLNFEISNTNTGKIVVSSQKERLF